jgi:hypothetical protein
MTSEECDSTIKFFTALSEKSKKQTQEFKQSLKSRIELQNAQVSDTTGDEQRTKS